MKAVASLISRLRTSSANVPHRRLKSPPESEAIRGDARNAVRWIAFISEQPAISRTERKYSVWRH